MITPKIYPITLYAGDDFDWQLNWKEKCGPTYDLSDYNAKLTLFVSDSSRTVVDQFVNPPTGREGIILAAISPNIWIHVPAGTVDYDPVPGFYILELQTPAAVDDFPSGAWFRLMQGKVNYEK